MFEMNHMVLTCGELDRQLNDACRAAVNVANEPRPAARAGTLRRVGSICVLARSRLQRCCVPSV